MSNTENLSLIFYSDKWRSYDGLVDRGYNKHFRVNHSDNEFSRNGDIHINGIENFWSFTPLEITADFNRRLSPLKADGGLKPPSASTVREPLSSLTGFTKRRLAKFNGVKENFSFYLKECDGVIEKILLY